jgi:hypothetical protein
LLVLLIRTDHASLRCSSLMLMLMPLLVTLLPWLSRGGYTKLMLANDTTQHIHMVRELKAALQ